jgi:co-chaperonin GroES (HSP10)
MAKIYTPVGARIIVEEITTSLSLEQRAANAGLEIITDERNRPKPSEGVIVALGSDPLLHDLFQVGDHVHFSRLGGTYVYHEGMQYRSLEVQEVIGVVREEV